MSELLEADSKKIYAHHKKASGDLASSDAEITEAGKALADARVDLRSGPYDADQEVAVKQAVQEAKERFEDAAETHISAHHEYPNSIAEGREHYEDNREAYHKMALKEAANKNIDFGGDEAASVSVIPEEEQKAH